MVRVFPYAAVQFLSFEFYKKSLCTLMPGSKNEHNHSLKFIAGASAGVTAAACTYPLDLIRARLAYNVARSVSTATASLVVPAANLNVAGFGETTISTASKFETKPTIANTFVTVVRTEGGFLALYKGLTPTLLAMIPYAGFSFYMFERLKHFVLGNKIFASFCGKSGTDQKVLNLPAKLLCGGFAGAIAQTFSYPLDVARRRMQLSMVNQETQKYSKNFIQTLTLVYNEYGIKKGLYRGMSINYIRAIPMVAVSFSTYEIMKQQLGLDTGIEK